jgi:hypothetical protein
MTPPFGPFQLQHLKFAFVRSRCGSKKKVIGKIPTPMKKVKIHKFKWTSKEFETPFFVANSKSKIVASVHCAYASKDKMIRIWPKSKRNNF